MRRFSALALLASCALPSVLAQVPCGTWEDLPTFMSAGDFPALDVLQVGPTPGEVHAAFFRATFNADAVVFRGHGSSWTQVGQNLGGRVRDLEFIDLGSGPELYAAGNFDVGVQTRTVVRFNGTHFEPLPALGQIAVALVGFDDGTGMALYAAAAFGVHRLQGEAWVPVGAPTQAASWTVLALAVHDDGSGPALYAGGSVPATGGGSLATVARWDGTAWSTVGSFAGAESFIGDLLSERDVAGPVLFALGHFAQADGGAANGVARFNGLGWMGLGANLPGVVQGETGSSLAWFDAGDGLGPALVVSSTLAGNVGFCARLHGTAWTSLPELPGGANFVGRPLAVVGSPGSADRALLGGRPLPGFSHALARLAACDLTGELFCFGDGAVAACPCGNESPAGERSGCRNSLGTGGALRAHGSASLAADTLVLAGSGMTDSSVLYFQAATQHAPTTFGDGLSCTGGPFRRLSTKANVLGASSYPLPGDPSVSVRGAVGSPGTRHYQARYRNSATFCTSDTFNYTSAVTIVWGS